MINLRPRMRNGAAVRALGDYTDPITGVYTPNAGQEGAGQSGDDYVPGPPLPGFYDPPAIPSGIDLTDVYGPDPSGAIPTGGTPMAPGQIEANLGALIAKAGGKPIPAAPYQGSVVHSVSPADYGPKQAQARSGTLPAGPGYPHSYPFDVDFSGQFTQQDANVYAIDGALISKGNNEAALRVSGAYDRARGKANLTLQAMGAYPGAASRPGQVVVTRSRPRIQGLGGRVYGVGDDFGSYGGGDFAGDYVDPGNYVDAGSVPDFSGGSIGDVGIVTGCFDPLAGLDLGGTGGDLQDVYYGEDVYAGDVSSSDSTLFGAIDTTGSTTGSVSGGAGAGGLSFLTNLLNSAVGGAAVAATTYGTLQKAIPALPSIPGAVTGAVGTIGTVLGATTTTPVGTQTAAAAAAAAAKKTAAGSSSSMGLLALAGLGALLLMGKH